MNEVVELSDKDSVALTSNQLIPINVKEQEFQKIMRNLSNGNGTG